MQYEIIYNPRGYYELWVNGEWHSNHDSHEEAKAEIEAEEAPT